MRSLHPITRLAAVGAAVVVPMFCRSLTAAAAGLVCGLICLLLREGLRPFLKMLCGSLIFGGAVALLDPLFSHRGMTVLLFINGRAYTLEAMLYGLELGLSLGGVTVWLTLARSLLTEREQLYVFGRLSPKLAMTVSMTLGFIPRLLAKQRRLTEAQRGAGLFTDSSFTGRLNKTSAVFMACVAWSAETAAGAAQSMNARGYGSHPISYSDRRRLRAADIVFLAAQTALTVTALIFCAKGGETNFFPTLQFGVYELRLTLAYGLGCLLPMIIHGKERVQWRLYAARG